MSRVSEPMFPILNDPVIRAIPWAALTPHEQQAGRNHSQTLKGLASRGGLSICEAYFILLDKRYPLPGPPQTPVNRAAFRAALMRLVHEFEKSRPTSSTTHTGGEHHG